MVQNIAILNYADVLRRFMANQSVSLADLDHGVQECFKREAHVEGFRFNALVLLKDNVVVYKLTGGQPLIQESEHTQNPLGPVQSIGNKLTGGWL